MCLPRCPHKMTAVGDFTKSYQFDPTSPLQGAILVGTVIRGGGGLKHPGKLLEVFRNPKTPSTRSVPFGLHSKSTQKRPSCERAYAHKHTHSLSLSLSLSLSRSRSISLSLSLSGDLGYLACNMTKSCNSFKGTKAATLSVQGCSVRQRGLA